MSCVCTNLSFGKHQLDIPFSKQYRHSVLCKGPEERMLHHLATKPRTISPQDACRSRWMLKGWEGLVKTQSADPTVDGRNPAPPVIYETL